MGETITTFDGIKHDKDEILEKMYDDEFYYGYLGQHALSSSALKKLLASPNEYIRSLEEDITDSQPLRDGKLFHWCVLEPKKFAELNVVDVASKNTKAYREMRDALGEVFIRREIDQAEGLAKVMKNNAVALDMLKDADYEVPVIDEIDGIPFRGKADIIKGTRIIDIKTTADMTGFHYAAHKFGYDLQAYLYLQLFPQADQFTFLVIDKKTQDIGVFECSEEFLESGREKLEKGIENYKFFFQGEIDLAQFVRYATL